MTQPWQLYLLWGVAVGLGTGSMATVLAATVANRWFVRRRGLVIGVLTAASATGQLVFLPLLAWLVTHNGWQSVSIAVSVATLAVVPLVLLFARNRPEDVGLLRYGATGDEPPPPPRQNPIAAAFGSLKVAVYARDFWLLAGSFFICGATTNGLIGTHFIPAGMDHGMTELAAANLLALIGIFDIIGTTTSGWLTDRYDNRKLLGLYYGFRAISIAALPFIVEMQGLLIFAVLYGLDWIATVPPTVNLTAQRFGRGSVGTIFGWIFCAHMVGAGLAAYAGGFFHDMLGNYHLVFISAALLGFVAVGLSMNIKRQQQPTALPA